MGINFKSLESIENNLKLNPDAQLMIVTKNQSQEVVHELISSGYKLFGENRVQEIEKKYLYLRKVFKFELHLIGPLQTNKVRQALQIVDTIQSIDRKKIVEEILKYWSSASRTKNFFIQINIGNEPQKSGISPEESLSFYKYCLEKKLPISGLMCIPPNETDPSVYFKEMVSIKNKLNINLKLSMGMSNDYLLALEHKSNIIRIGSLIFD